MSNGVAAAWPTTGMIFSVADVSLHGSAATAQPPSGSSAAPSVNHAATRIKRSGMLGVDTRASVRQAVVLTRLPTSPDGSDGSDDGDGGVSLADSGSCGVAGELFGVAGFSAARIGASEEKRVEVRWL